MGIWLFLLSIWVGNSRPVEFHYQADDPGSIHLATPHILLLSPQYLFPLFFSVPFLLLSYLSPKMKLKR